MSTTQTPEHNTVHAAIATGTYAEMGASAIELYDSIRAQQALHNGEADLAAPVGLDIGGYDGAYRSVLGALGVERVITIEPRWDVLDKGVQAGIIPQEDAFHGTLQEWVEAGNKPVQTAAVFNMMRPLPARPDFLQALSAATVSGGFVVTTFREPISMLQFMTATARDKSLGLRVLHAPGTQRIGTSTLNIRNKFLQLHRRQG
jgi:hypothetical protein